MVAIGLFFIISDFPEEAIWLTPEEKAFVKARLEDDVGHSGRDEKVKVQDVISAFKDCKCNRPGAILDYSLWRRQELPWCFDVFRTYCSCI